MYTLRQILDTCLKVFIVDGAPAFYEEHDESCFGNRYGSFRVIIDGVEYYLENYEDDNGNHIQGQRLTLYGNGRFVCALETYPDEHWVCQDGLSADGAKSW